MSDIVQLTCSREGCHPELGQGCIEGLAIRDCPHHNGIVIPVEIIDESREDIAQSSVNSVRVHNGDALTMAEADLFLRRNNASVVALIGCPDAGKTTAAVMLYELIKRARLGKYSFAGSRTIRGFQSRSFRSILSSGLIEPDTERTKGSKPVEFLHLKIGISGTGELKDLIMVDRTGEDFESCMKKPDLCMTFPEIPRADCHVLLVDGKKMVDTSLAAHHANEVFRIFLSLSRAPLKNLQLVLTKYDTVINSPEKEVGLSKFVECEEDIRRRLDPKTVFSTHYLAARPSMAGDNESLVGHGLEDLIEPWFKSSSLERSFVKKIPEIEDGRPFDLLINTVGAEVYAS